MLSQRLKDYDIIVYTILYLLLIWSLLRGVAWLIRLRSRSNRIVLRGGRFARVESNAVNYHFSIVLLRLAFTQIKRHFSGWRIVDWLRKLFICSLSSNSSIPRHVETTAIAEVSIQSPKPLSQPAAESESIGSLSSSIANSAESQLLVLDSRTIAISCDDSTPSSTFPQMKVRNKENAKEEPQQHLEEKKMLPPLPVNQKDSAMSLQQDSESTLTVITTPHHSNHSIPLEFKGSYNRQHQFLGRHAISNNFISTPSLKRPFGESEDALRPWKRIPLPKTPSSNRTTHLETNLKKRRSIQDLWNEFDRPRRLRVDSENASVSAGTSHSESIASKDIDRNDDSSQFTKSSNSDTTSTSLQPSSQEQANQNQLHDIVNGHKAGEQGSIEGNGNVSQPSTISFPPVTNFETTQAQAIQTSLRRRGGPQRSSLRGRSVRRSR
jgi:hypothetical protein